MDSFAHSKSCIVYEVKDICKKYKDYHNTNNSDLFEQDAENIIDQLREMPSSISVRSGWNDSPKEFKPEEFKIELSGGGPATRIIGELDHHCEVYSVKAQHQDWGIPWTDLVLDEQQETAVKWFAGLFYFGG